MQLYNKFLFQKPPFIQLHIIIVYFYILPNSNDTAQENCSIINAK